MDNNKKKHADKYIFYICLIIAIMLFVGGFLCPPMGVIDGSVLKAAGILLGFAALGVAGQNLANGKEISLQKDDLNLTIGDDKDEDKK
jgi:small neutral amino acid transporter SnatA (MarC family)